ncbi:ferric reductase like transmembrane component-domain-containing protein [Naematelia encephala]|uniref:ferric-chelate reductase (NADPH) n=1 Tax=Naematelia encephala TaxID=71784 RepID=A0A1Y2BLM6_9TREE|nr:ferric reductase like transmembrane component-domain-containing protein [Naematelia encephala]
MGLPAPVGYLYWYTTSIILAIFTLANIISRIYYYVTRPAPLKRPAFTELPPDASSNASQTSTLTPSKLESGQSTSARRGDRVGRAARAGIVIFEEVITLSALPLPHLRFWIKRTAKASIPTTELGCNVAYLAGILTLSFYRTAWDARTVSNQAAWLAVAQIPLIIALAGKNNLISFLTGISYEKLNFLHRAAGRTCVIGIWIHAIGQFYLSKGFDAQRWKEPLTQWGVTGLISFSLIYVVAIPYVRRRLYEFFLVAHICMVALSIAASIMHWRAIDVWLYPGVGLWAADRLFRILRVLILNHLWKVIPSPTAANLTSTATLTLLTPSALMVTFETPSQYLRWHAGQHFYVIMPGMSRLPWEAHPFTAATIPKNPELGADSGELTFIVRVRDGFTRRMKEAVDTERKAQGLGVEEHCKISVKAAVEGPYGEARDLRRFDSVLILAGGSGISQATSNLLQIIREAREGTTQVKSVQIIWMVKSRLHLNWISPLLLAHVNSLPTTLNVDLHVHVTKHYLGRTGSMALPNDPSTAPHGWLGYLHREAREPRRRKSRFLSTMSWATFTDAFDLRRDHSSGPSTRRGSVAVTSSGSGKSSINKKSSKSTGRPNETETEKANNRESEEQDRMKVPTFAWSEGYGDDVLPVDFAFQSGQRKSRASEAPSFHALKEEDIAEQDQDIAPDEKIKIRSVEVGQADAEATDGPRVSFETPEHHVPRVSLEVPPRTPSPRARIRDHSGRRVSIELPERPARVSLEVPERAPSPRSRMRDHGGPRGSVDTPERAVSPLSRGVHDWHSPSPRTPLRGPSALAREVEPDEEDSPNSSDGPVTPATPAPVAVRNRALSFASDENSHHLRRGLSGQSSSPSGSRRGSLLAPMARRSTIINQLSIMLHPDENTSTYSPTQAASQNGTLPAPILMAREQSDQSILSSGALTPALSERGEHTPVSTSFPATEPARRRQSIGLEHILHWHEGRADLRAAIEAAVRDIQEHRKEGGGWLSVSACGPKSLLESARDSVKEASSARDVWAGGVGIEFRAETFGW